MKYFGEIIKGFRVQETMKLKEIYYNEDFRESYSQASNAFKRNGIMHATPWYSFDDEL